MRCAQGSPWDQSHDLLACRETPTHFLVGNSLSAALSPDGKQGGKDRSKSYQETGDKMSPFPRKIGWEASALPQGRFSSPMGEFSSPEGLFEQDTWTPGLPSTESHKKNENLYLLSSFPCEGRQSNLSSLPSWFLLPGFAHGFTNKSSRKGCENEQRSQFPGLEGTSPLGNFKFQTKPVESPWVISSFWNQTGYKSQAGLQPGPPTWTDGYFK